MDRRKLSEEEERELVESAERGEWISVGDIEERRAFWTKMARQAFDGKRRRISISIPERDLALLKTRGGRGHALSGIDQLHPAQICRRVSAPAGRGRVGFAGRAC